MTLEQKLDKQQQVPTQPYLIAEIGVNHFDIAERRGIRSLEAAKTMIEKAATAGADAVKFQSYSADRLATTDATAYWDTSEETQESQYELFARYDSFGRDEFEELAEWTGANHDVDFLSTPFDPFVVDYLQDIVPAYKIASADITNHPLLRHVAQKQKPILLSTGASTLGEIDSALDVINDHSSAEVCLFHCILDYPTAKSDANLGMIRHLSQAFPNCAVGYSDHVAPDSAMITLLGAVVQGATIIEKHFTLNKDIGGNDHYHAMSPDDIQEFRRNVDTFLTTVGENQKKPIEAEKDSRQYARRSIVAATEIQEGEMIQREHLAMKRPGTGISPGLIDIILGRNAQCNIEADEILSWEMI
jgi:N-acetylneuraminate synthase